MRGDEHLRHGRRGELVEVGGNGGDVPFVDEDTVGQPAAADDAEDAVTGLKAPRRGAMPDHRAGRLDAGNVGRRAGRSGIAARPLCQIGAVERGVAHGQQHVVSRRRRIRPLLERDDLVVPGAGEDDRAHRSSVLERFDRGGGA